MGFVQPKKTPIFAMYYENNRRHFVRISTPPAQPPPLGGLIHLWNLGESGSEHNPPF